MSKLSDRLAEAKATLGLSTRRMADLAEQDGLKLSTYSATVYTNGKHPDTPDRETLKALSHVLRVPLDELHELAGLPVATGPFVPHKSADLLTPRQRDAVNEIIRLLAESEQKAGDGDVRNDSRDTAPMNDGSSTVTDLGGERRRRDDWAFGHRVRGDLGVPPVPEVYAAYESPSEGKARWEEDQARGEESQLPPEDYE